MIPHKTRDKQAVSNREYYVLFLFGILRLYYVVGWLDILRLVLSLGLKDIQVVCVFGGRRARRVNEYWHCGSIEYINLRKSHAVYLLIKEPLQKAD
jgi:hypothetical protein